MKITRKQLRKLVSEIVQVPAPKPGQRMVHKVEEDVTEEMLVDSLYERKHRTKRINEAMENPPFQFSINPAEYIRKDQPIEEMNQMISLILDADGISYYTERRNFLGKSTIAYQFGYADAEDGDSDEEDPESYEAGEALVSALRNAGVLTTDQVRNDRDLRDNTHFSFTRSRPDRGIKSVFLMLRQSIK
jgi:hypothetical protein